MQDLTFNYDAPFRTTPISETHDFASSFVINEETGHEPDDSLSEHDKNDTIFDNKVTDAKFQDLDDELSDTAIKNKKSDAVGDSLDSIGVRIGAVYTIDQLRMILDEYGTRKHFQVRRGGPKFHCHRGYASKSAANRDRCKVPGQPKRKRNRSMKCGCLWSVTFTDYADDKTKVKVTAVCDEHANHIPDMKEMVAVVFSSTKPKPIDDGKITKSLNVL